MQKRAGGGVSPVQDSAEGRSGAGKRKEDTVDCVNQGGTAGIQALVPVVQTEAGVFLFAIQNNEGVKLQ